MDVLGRYFLSVNIHYLAAVAVVVLLCVITWLIGRGRWRWVAAAVTFQSAVFTFFLSDYHQATSEWAVVGGAAWGFFIASFFAVALILPAVALWRSGRIGMVFSVLLVIWWVGCQSIFLVYPIWDGWHVCLPPGAYFGPENDGPSCEMGPM